MLATLTVEIEKDGVFISQEGSSGVLFKWGNLGVDRYTNDATELAIGWYLRDYLFDEGGGA
jgi:hypothetical protein